MSSWNTADIPDQSGRVAVVTGANSGLGFETAKALAARGANVVLAVRNLDKGTEAASAIAAAASGAEVALQRLDLGSLASVRVAADELKSEYGRIDLLINNAGLMYPPKGNTSDGFELQFGTNHLGHFALTGLLFDRLVATPGSRVVTVTSGTGHRARAAIHFDDLHWERSYDRIGAYGQSKLANLLFTYELQRRLNSRGTSIAAAAHPGGARTNLHRDMPTLVRISLDTVARLAFHGPDLGALPTLRAATDPGVLGGQFFGPSGLGEFRGHPTVQVSSEQSYDFALQRRLWAVSEELTGVGYPSV